MGSVEIQDIGLVAADIYKENPEIRTELHAQMWDLIEDIEYTGLTLDDFNYNNVALFDAGLKVIDLGCVFSLAERPKVTQILKPGEKPANGPPPPPAAAFHAAKAVTARRRLPGMSC